MRKLIFIIILSIVYSVQAQTDDKENLKQINEKVISSYQNQLMDDAVKFARQAVELSVKIYGAETQETASAYTNLGIIYREIKKFKESIENLQTAAIIYQKLPNADAKEFIEVYETLALSQRMGGQKVEAEASYLKAVEVAENKYGKESKEILSPTLNLANLYARDKKLEKADEFYLKGYAASVKNFGKDSKEVERIGEFRMCSSLASSGNKNSDDKDREKYEKSSEAVKAILGYDEGLRVINGKAISLAKAPYPPEAKSQRIGGVVIVKVKVDEQGNVIEARAFCGHPILGKAVEEAARKTKFTPTLLDGKQVMIRGILVYNFIAAPL